MSSYKQRCEELYESLELQELRKVSKELIKDKKIDNKIVGYSYLASVFTHSGKDNLIIALQSINKAIKLYRQIDSTSQQSLDDIFIIKARVLTLSCKYNKAIEVYNKVFDKRDIDESYKENIYYSFCKFMIGNYKDASFSAKKAMIEPYNSYYTNIFYMIDILQELQHPKEQLFVDAHKEVQESITKELKSLQEQEIDEDMSKSIDFIISNKSLDDKIQFIQVHIKEQLEADLNLDNIIQEYITQSSKPSLLLEMANVMSNPGSKSNSIFGNIVYFTIVVLIVAYMKSCVG